MAVIFQMEQAHTLDSAGVFSFSEPKIHAERILPYHVLLYLEYGAWDLSYSGREFSFCAGDVVVMPARVRHFGVTACAPGTRGIFLHALPNAGDSPPFSSGDGAGECRLAAVTHTTDRERVHALFLEILRQYQTRQPYANRLCGSLFDALLLTLQDRQQQNDLLRRQVDLLLHDHMDEILTNADLAALLHRSEKSLERAFRAESGQTLHSYQMARKLESAYSLFATYPESTLYEVACMLGFYDTAHLSRCFKLRFGVSPSVVQRKKQDG